MEELITFPLLLPNVSKKLNVRIIYENVEKTKTKGGSEYSVKFVHDWGKGHIISNSVHKHHERENGNKKQIHTKE